MLQSKNDLSKRLTATGQKRDRIAAMVAQGKSLADIKAAWGEPPAAAGGRGGRK